jgi:hypothetical protein
MTRQLAPTEEEVLPRKDDSYPTLCSGNLDCPRLQDAQDHVIYILGAALCLPTKNFDSANKTASNQALTCLVSLLLKGKKSASTVTPPRLWAIQTQIRRCGNPYRHESHE